MSNEPRATDFWRSELHMGTVVSVTNQPNNGQADNRMLCDVVPANSHSYAYQVPMVLPPGLARRPRKGMYVALSYAMGSPQFGYVLGHSFNNDVSAPYNDQWPLAQLQTPSDWQNIIPNVDDLAYYHDETGVFWRFRSAQNASPTTAGALGGPGIGEFKMRSGVVFAFEEYPLDDPPPQPQSPPGPNPPAPIGPAQRAKLTLTMPAGTKVLYDEPEVGVATLSVTIPNDNGATTLTIGKDGVVTVNAVNDVTINATNGAVPDGGGGEEDIEGVSTNTLTTLLDTVNAKIKNTATIPTGTAIDHVVDGGALDGAGAISSIVAPGGLIGFGNVEATSIDSTMAAMNQDIMNGPYADLVNAFALKNLQEYITALTTSLSAGGLPNPSAFSTSMVGIIVAGWLTKIADVTGSATVRLQT